MWFFLFFLVNLINFIFFLGFFNLFELKNYTIPHGLCCVDTYHTTTRNEKKKLEKKTNALSQRHGMTRMYVVLDPTTRTTVMERRRRAGRYATVTGVVVTSVVRGVPDRGYCYDPSSVHRDKPITD